MQNFRPQCFPQKGINGGELKGQHDLEIRLGPLSSPFVVNGMEREGIEI